MEFSVGPLLDCPPPEAEAKNIMFFRACDSHPPSKEDFTPHTLSVLPRKKKRANMNNCEHWGLSGWISHEDAAHAQQVFDWLKSKYIFKMEIAFSEGRIKQTSAPPHHTFWPCTGVNVLGRAKIALPPIKAKT